MQTPCPPQTTEEGGGGSHTSRLATSIGSTYPEVVDLTIGGWILTEKSGENLAYDI